MVSLQFVFGIHAYAVTLLFDCRLAYSVSDWLSLDNAIAPRMLLSPLAGCANLVACCLYSNTDPSQR